MELLISTHPMPGAASEDAFAVAPDGSAAVLVDGAGLPAELRAGCGHSVRWYAGTLAQAMLDRLIARTGTPSQALAAAIGDVLAAHGPGCRPEAGSPSGTVAAWRISPGTVPGSTPGSPPGSPPNAQGGQGDSGLLEYVVLADSTLFLRDVDGLVTEIVDESVDDLTGVERARIAAELIASGSSESAARVAAHRRTTERLRNVDGGFWCAHVDPGAAAHALTGAVPLDRLDAVVLASDRVTRLIRPFGRYTPSQLLHRILTGAAADLVAELRATEVEEVALTRRIAVKPHDDATIVAAVLPRGGPPEHGPAPAASSDRPLVTSPFSTMVPKGLVTNGQPVDNQGHAAWRAALPGTPGYAVRPAHRTDVPAILALIVADQIGAARESDVDHPGYLAAFEAIDADPGELLVVIVDDADAVCGSFQLSLLPGLARRGSLRCQIEAVRVAASLRGSGIGAAAMRWAIEWARGQGCSLVQLTTDKSRGDAHRFYGRLGFVASHEGMKLRLT